MVWNVEENGIEDSEMKGKSGCESDSGCLMSRSQFPKPPERDELILLIKNISRFQRIGFD